MAVKVLHLINGEFYSGAERVQDLLALNLPSHGVQCDFACLKPGKFIDSRKSINAKIYPVYMQSKFDFSIVSRLVRLIKDENYQVIHTHTARSALIGRFVSWLAHVPMVHHLHSPTRSDTENKLRNALNVLIERFSLSHVARVIPVSNSLGKYATSCGFPAGKITVIPNGVPIGKQFTSWEKKNGPWVIGTVALFRPRKGLEVLCQSLKQLIDKGIDVRLHAVGGFETSDYEYEIKMLCRKLDIEKYIDWVGFTTDVNSEFAKMDVFVLPSLFGEGLPMVVIEAMAACVPVVSTAVEGIPEVIGVDNSGFVAQPSNVESLTEQLFSLMSLPEDDVKKVTENAYLRQKNNFSDVAMSKRVADVYFSILS